MRIKKFAEINEEENTQSAKVPYKVVVDVGARRVSIQLRFVRDGVRLIEIMEAIDSIKNKDVVAQAFASNDVMAMCKVGARYHMLGSVSKKMYDGYLKLKEKQKAGDVVDTTKEG
jgi:hypothetical protein